MSCTCQPILIRLEKTIEFSYFAPNGIIYAKTYSKKRNLIIRNSADLSENYFFASSYAAKSSLSMGFQRKKQKILINQALSPYTAFPPLELL